MKLPDWSPSLASKLEKQPCWPEISDLSILSLPGQPIPGRNSKSSRLVMECLCKQCDRFQDALRGLQAFRAVAQMCSQKYASRTLHPRIMFCGSGLYRPCETSEDGERPSTTHNVSWFRRHCSSTASTVHHFLVLMLVCPTLCH